MAIRGLLSALIVSLAAAWPKLGDYMMTTDRFYLGDLAMDAASIEKLLAKAHPDYAAAQAIFLYGQNACLTRQRKVSLQSTSNVLAWEHYGIRSSNGSTSELEELIRNALAGTGAMQGLSDPKRVAIVNTGIKAFMMNGAMDRVNSALAQATIADERREGKGYVPLSESQIRGAARDLLDDGWALYYGSDSDGRSSPYDAAKMLSAQSTGLQEYEVMGRQFNLVMKMVDTYFRSTSTIRADAAHIVDKLNMITCVRAILMNVQIAEKVYSEIAHAAAFAYATACSVQIQKIWSESSGPDKFKGQAFQLVELLHINKTSIVAGTYCAVKEKIEMLYTPSRCSDVHRSCSWEESSPVSLGISCSHVGVFNDAATAGITSCAACSGPTVTLNTTGADAQEGNSNERESEWCSAASDARPFTGAAYFADFPQTTPGTHLVPHKAPGANLLTSPFRVPDSKLKQYGTGPRTLFMDFDKFNTSTCRGKVGTTFEQGVDLGKLVMFAFLWTGSCYGYSAFDASQTQTWASPMLPTETWYYVVDPSGCGGALHYVGGRHVGPCGGGTPAPVTTPTFLKPTTTKALQDLLIKSALTLTVGDADALLNDTIAIDAIRDGISKTLIVTPSQVVLTMTTTRRLATGATRRLFSVQEKASVMATYIVTVPATSGAELQSFTLNRTQTTPAKKFTGRIQAAVTDAKGAGAHSVSVAWKGAVLWSYVTPTPIGKGLVGASSAMGRSQMVAAVALLVSVMRAYF